MKVKQRLSASIDGDLLRAAEDAVAAGRSSSISAWVNEALRLKVAHDRRLEALGAFIDAYEQEHGTITPLEVEMAARHARRIATPVRGVSRPTAASSRRRRSAG